MLHENLKQLRIQSGMSQEIMAQQLHVVRQTISKWEKGISVPDADMLRNIAELFDVSVSDLLGELEPKNTNEIAVQLALLNAQLADRTRRTRSIWMGIGVGLLVIAVLCLALAYGNTLPNPGTEPGVVILLTCTLDGETYYYTLNCDREYSVYGYGGDPWLHETVVIPVLPDGGGQKADVFISLIRRYFQERGGTVVVGETGPGTYIVPR